MAGRSATEPTGSGAAAGSEGALLAGLNERQRQAALTLVGPVRILAGAGTGKTRTITHRIAYGIREGVYDPARVLALTFTSKAAGELRARLSALGVPAVAARTFHAAALSQLGYFWPHTIGGAAPRLLAGKGPLLGQAASELGLRLDPAAVRDAAAEIEWRKVRELSIDGYLRAAASRPLPAGLDAQQLAELQHAYERLKDAQRRMDFEDVLLATVGMLELEPWVTQQVREQYRFFVVDEYQDVSPLQQHLLRLWLGQRRDLCVVGDPAQTVFGFTGATSDYLTGFHREFPGARTVELEHNYRSTAPIIDLANRVAQEVPHALRLVAAGQDGGVQPQLHAYPGEEAEAQAVADRIAQELTEGTPPGQVAVLYRLRGQAEPLERALSAAGVPYRLHGQRRFFEQPEVRMALAALRGQALAGDTAPLFQSVGRVVRDLGWRPTAPSGGAEKERWMALDAIVRLADAAEPGTTVVAFAARLQQQAQLQLEPELGAVTLSTMHAAKGLEWDSVHLVGLSEGLLPYFSATVGDALEEERRLFYVAITRARRRLALSYAVQSADRAAQRRAPSRFLAGLGSRIQHAPATDAAAASPSPPRS